MAIINSGSPWYGAKGKIGGLTLQGGLSGTIIKVSKTKLKKPRLSTANQLNKFVYFQQLYKSLGSSDRTDWENFASSNNFIDKYNNTKIISGVNYFTSINRYNAITSQPDILSPPSYALADELSSLDCTNASPILKLNYTLYTPPVSVASIIYFSGPVRAGSAISFNGLKCIGYYLLSGSSSLDLTSDWEATTGLNFATDVVNKGNAVNVAVMNCNYSNLIPRNWQLVQSSN